MQIGKQFVVSSTVEQQFNNQQNEFLWALLADPANDGYAYTSDLQRLVDDFPHSGILRALLAHSDDKKHLKQAAVYFNPHALFKLVNASSALNPVSDQRIVLHGKNRAEMSAQSESNNSAEEILTGAEHERQEEQNREGVYHETITMTPEEQSAATELPHEHQPHEDIEDETYEEIVGIEDINTQSAPAAAVEEEKIIAEDVTSGDFFTLDKAFGDHEPAAETEEPQGEASGPEVGQHDLSKYNDDKMPYTFMWWLDKTRREHASMLQPYAKPPAANPNAVKSPVNELQQQYYENIFHLTSLEELGKDSAGATPGLQTKRKEQEIIERFIQEEPQIKPQSSDKLDNENKAKKSAEDQDELVTETLAAIYTDQMLYHKAIASYRKLMLKFPEKSRYFAAKIEQLEKRTN
ncbi:MAG TPA: hypothetical protein VNW95_09100 [Mucilaginibacter sp.]|nr:hypothetical protein [Mucilaginibacter sp.]